MLRVGMAHRAPHVLVVQLLVMLVTLLLCEYIVQAGRLNMRAANYAPCEVAHRAPHVIVFQLHVKIVMRAYAARRSSQRSCGRSCSVCGGTSRSACNTLAPWRAP
eukprot:gnl/TRDRNA2_/TRDRNA2_91774_c0_seq1.p1 gnl/TRDRNA2_/TRDRNA2_91774_c0~~gnl/TRDRNA2_/TRDRNA2_91774_c0_seq1.p1  ORF type:complete len:105 (+),score=6.26 gnl/TRDRNA2_/TRDRNA2_91774_c0_seq1:159-473(+)